jgi:hypothetical protein
VRFYLLFCLFSASVHLSLYGQVTGCTDPLANNFNSSATQNDGTCTYSLLSLDAIQSWPLPTEVLETSGLASWDNFTWTHNDNSETFLHGLDTAGGVISVTTVPLAGIINHDWEELKVDEAYIYVADVGNNGNGNRQDLHVLRIERSSWNSGSPLIDTIRYSYALQTDFSGTGPNATDFDCEAFITTADSIFLFTKEWNTNKTSLYALPNAPGNHVAEWRGELDVQGLITGATSLLNDQLIILVGYTETLMPFFYLLYDFNETQFFSGNKRKVMMNLPFHQIEGVTTTNGTEVLVSNEKFQQSILTVNQKLHRFDLSSVLSNYLNPSSASLNALKEAVPLHIFPNPVTSEVFIEVQPYLVGEKMSVLNAKGITVFEQEITTPSFKLDCSSWAAGTYHIQISGHEGAAVKCVVSR